jgi:hypothetical protein
MRAWEIPITDVVQKAVEKMGAEQGVKSLKMQNRRKDVFYPADWTAGVNYEANNNNDENNDENNDDIEYEYHDENADVHYDEDAELDDEEAYDRINQEEIDELLAEPRDEVEEAYEDPKDNEVIPIVEDEEQDKANDDNADDNELESSPLLRTQPARARTQPERLT